MGTIVKKGNTKLVKVIIGIAALLLIVGIVIVSQVNKQVTVIEQHVSYRSLTNAHSTQTVAEIYNTDKGYYPADTNEFINEGTRVKLPDSITVLPGAKTTPLNAHNGENTVTWECLDTCTKTLGGRITYWDSTTNAVSTKVLYVGDATADSVFVAPEK